MNLFVYLFISNFIDSLGHNYILSPIQLTSWNSSNSNFAFRLAATENNPPPNLPALV